ncbi:DnaA regulatory inactivator Hda [Thauera humireducens]|jgi:DnaA family protein|uniref:DnaA regulatory inactivator Hda n=1 Tax=Thauera humireducens TaxID=1134435 RepID=A0A127K634_9RHOO|nr:MULTISPECIES: DnaA regulatory inactivator Hda [Thauera]AMO37114.1 DnaA regulatory inactivator Hda [Thauera humireducens]ENO76784.1 DnaA regulatory inactivator Hda [Thauera sp. 63]CAH1747660.1 DnaA regulatory inactivator Hda [Thauera humireducens]
MKQLVLDIRPDAPPTLENFVAGANAELVAMLSLQASLATAGQLPARHLYVWGAPGSGRSHLLRATVAMAREHGRPTHLLAAEDVEDGLPETADALVAVDDIDQLSPDAQIGLFNAFNRSRGNGQSLLLTGPVAPLGLRLREDLRTRIGQCLIYEVQPLDDDSRATILATLAERRGLRLADEVVDFLLRHGRRELSSLLAVLDALDAASLERKRPITLPLLREMMQQGLEI